MCGDDGGGGGREKQVDNYDAMDAYVILGDPGSGKSTTIRHLAGRGRNLVAAIETLSGPLRVYVHMGSLQEKEKAADEFIAEVAATGAEAVVFSLWIRNRNKPPFPSGATYLTAFVRAGWKIKFIEALWVDSCPDEYTRWQNCFTSIAGYSGIDPDDLANWIPSNRIASDIRARWGWA